MALIAIVLSIAAVAISVFEVSAMREQYTASVWPYVAVEKSYSADGFTISIANKGVGPAVIGAVELRVADTPVTAVGSFFEKFFAARAADDAYYAEENVINYYDYRSGDASYSVLAPGEKSVLFGLPWKTNRIRTERLVEDILAEGVNADVCYCSLSGECWTAELNKPLAQRIEQCPGLDDSAPGAVARD